jgi:hypothetical protein
MDVLERPGKMLERYVRAGILSLRQLSTTERIAAIFGPACGLPMCSQFFRPRATGREESGIDHRSADLWEPAASVRRAFVPCRQGH